MNGDGEARAAAVLETYLRALNPRVAVGLRGYMRASETLDAALDDAALDEERRARVKTLAAIADANYADADEMIRKGTRSRQGSVCRFLKTAFVVCLYLAVVGASVWLDDYWLLFGTVPVAIVHSIVLNDASVFETFARVAESCGRRARR